MFYQIRSAIRNAKCFNDVKGKLLLSEKFLKPEGEIIKVNTISKDLSSYPNSLLFFNDVSILLEEGKWKEMENLNEKEKNVLLFNKVRNDKRHRKRAFQKRGYWKKMHYFVRKNNMMCFAFKVQNIDYEKIKKLKRGEVYHS
ncbi:conserved Plasmodium protein, unknown function [Plasmodium ovale]|uniref:Uncharacterized protein n=2 Tax=Plasmodium ovale TaxID=36330 RepID=A0A1A8WM55_PLAOA|nr:conserved Plasmodium protein, unknown function [Plasmodium ovale curtisi]SBS92942.1 conserved Plasmodium protein, unknown function [Plasmodium ovale curtisi]SCQ16543.1 conserved Plasmodium protein, unknown function [Plasmodium ovale]